MKKIKNYVKLNVIISILFLSFISLLLFSQVKNNVFDNDEIAITNNSDLSYENEFDNYLYVSNYSIDKNNEIEMFLNDASSSRNLGDLDKDSSQYKIIF